MSIFYLHFLCRFKQNITQPSYTAIYYHLIDRLSSPHQEYVQFFKHKLGRSVSWGDRMEFINGWYLLLIVSDMFTIIGSFIKIGIESKVT